jgi:hypothetical protein
LILRSALDEGESSLTIAAAISSRAARRPMRPWSR